MGVGLFNGTGPKTFSALPIEQLIATIRRLTDAIADLEQPMAEFERRLERPWKS